MLKYVCLYMDFVDIYKYLCGYGDKIKLIYLYRF